MLDKDIIIHIFGFLNFFTNRVIKELCDPYYNIPEEFCCIQSTDIDIHNIDAGDIKKYINLVYIYSLRTQTKDIPWNLVELKELDICRTYVSVVPKTLVKLTSLFCEGTPILEVPRNLVKLQRLYASGTLITKVPNVFVNLTELGCSKTNVSEIPKELVKLRVIYFSRSKITEVPKELVNLKRLHYFDDVSSLNKIYIPPNICGLYNFKIQIHDDYYYEGLSDL